ncbi:MAG: hypothetical protein KIT87_13405 [Anaerolineae bacterium]|nr:hypothetical protein [Anaerolineae bacterium]
MNEYSRLRRAAFWREVQATLTRHPYLLVPYEEVRQRLYGVAPVDRGIQTIRLDQIVGSLGRARDFTRDFLPLNETTSDRWRRLREAWEKMASLPPIEVYQVGECYFISDGNHRVSVARSMGSRDIEARVLEVPVRAAIRADMTPEQILRAAEKAGFLARTGLDRTRPDVNIEVTIPLGYSTLGRQIELVWGAGQTGNTTLTLAQAAVQWYDEAYAPIATVIHASGWERDFQRRTQADLYVWLMEHLARLQAEYGRAVDAEIAFEDFQAQKGGGRWGQFVRTTRQALRHWYGDDTPKLVERLVDRYEEKEVEHLVDELAAAERWLAELDAEEAAQGEA